MQLLRRASDHLVRRIPIKALPCRLTRSVASIAFADFPKSAWRAGGPVLSHYGASATFYVSGALHGRRLGGLEYYDMDDLVAAHAAGHEIGSHTFAHLHTGALTSRELMADVAKNDRFIREHIGDVIPATFAYPFRDISLRVKILYSQRFACCLGTQAGINRGLLDLSQLKVVTLESPAHTVDQAIAVASKVPSWIIFLGHDVSSTPSPNGTTPSMLEEVLEKTRAADIEVLTVKNALARACHRQ